MTEQFEPMTMFVDGLIASGLTLFWGSPKSGKSVAALQLLVGVVAGSHVFGVLKCHQAAGLYITYEDGIRRLQRRLKDMGAPLLDDLHFSTGWPTGRAGVEAVDQYLDDYPEIRVVVIDPWQAFADGDDFNDYKTTAGELGQIKHVADERDIAIIVVHHSRKPAHDFRDVDFIDTALGSRGLTGKPDHLLMLARNGKAVDATVQLRSKDIEPTELAMRFELDTKSWAVIGDASEIAKTRERQDILDVMARTDGPMKTGEIARALNKKTDNASHLLSALSREGKVHSTRYGTWSLVGSSATAIQTTQTIQTSEIGQGDLEHVERFEGSPPVSPSSSAAGTSASTADV